MSEYIANFSFNRNKLDFCGALNENKLHADLIVNAPVGDKHYTYTQAIPSDTWIINHNLNKKPSIEVVDSAGNVQIPDEAKVVDNNTVIVKFIAAFAGEAYLN